MRSRNLKPGLFKNELLGSAEPLLSLLFAGLWCLADRDGRLEDRPLRIRAEIFPYRDCDIAPMLAALAEMGFIRRYNVGARALIQVSNFAKHQAPHHTEKKSILPGPVNSPLDNGELTVNPPLEHGEYPPDSLIPSSLIPDSGKIPAPVEMAGGTDIPTDLHPLNYAAKICEQIGIPSENQNLRAFAGALEVLVKGGKSRAAAFEFLLARVLDEKELGQPVTWTFWCRDGRFNFPAGASPANGQRPTDSQFMGRREEIAQRCPLNICDGSGWWAEEGSRKVILCECHSTNVGVSA